ncbi:MAG: TatD family hydrolase [Alphaproteobacteria bacterium]|nr:TatD family hydrolase [Alphaproteobacteria bacterium]
MKKYIDAHCHLFDEKLPDNIGAIVNATRPSEWGGVIAQANKNINVWGAIGVHPWFVADLVADWDEQLQDLLIQNPEIMFGEIGLDKHRPDMDLQIDVFSRQLEIAAELGRGVHVHCVGAWDKMFAVLKRYKSQQIPFILFHRFSGNAGDVARLCADYNAYFSFMNARNVVADVPSNRVLIETDSNNPLNIMAVSERVAAICPKIDFYKNTMEMLKNG